MCKRALASSATISVRLFVCVSSRGLSLSVECVFLFASHQTGFKNTGRPQRVFLFIVFNAFIAASGDGKAIFASAVG